MATLATAVAAVRIRTAINRLRIVSSFVIQEASVASRPWANVNGM
jgi:hypothetical protein